MTSRIGKDLGSITAPIVLTNDNFVGDLGEIINILNRDYIQATCRYNDKLTILFPWLLQKKLTDSYIKNDLLNYPKDEKISDRLNGTKLLFQYHERIRLDENHYVWHCIAFFSVTRINKLSEINIKELIHSGCNHPIDLYIVTERD